VTDAEQKQLRAAQKAVESMLATLERVAGLGAHVYHVLPDPDVKAPQAIPEFTGTSLASLLWPLDEFTGWTTAWNNARRLLGFAVLGPTILAFPFEGGLAARALKSSSDVRDYHDAIRKLPTIGAAVTATRGFLKEIRKQLPTSWSPARIAVGVLAVGAVAGLAAWTIVERRKLRQLRGPADVVP
jgi:hypothetical protein